jgi:protein phosphatase
MHCPFNDNFAGAGLSDPGLARKHNEDRFVVDAAAGLLMVADGVGGHNAGALASTEAVAAIRQSLGGSFGGQDSALGEEDITLLDLDKPLALAGSADAVPMRDSTAVDQAQILAAVKHANDIVHGMNRIRELTPETAMGTTILGLQFRPGRPMEATIFHVGDSRLYLLRDDRLA